MAEPEHIGGIIKRVMDALEELRKGNQQNSAGGQNLNLGKPLPLPARLPVGMEDHGITTSRKWAP